MGKSGFLAGSLQDSLWGKCVYLLAFGPAKSSRRLPCPNSSQRFLELFGAPEPVPEEAPQNASQGQNCSAQSAQQQLFCFQIGVRGSPERDISSLRALGPGGGQISRVVHVSTRAAFGVFCRKVWFRARGAHISREKVWFRGFGKVLVDI